MAVVTCRAARAAAAARAICVGRALLCALISAGAIGATAAGADAQDKTRPATAADFAGVYRLLDFPLQQQPKYLKESPWPAPCQFFGHYPDGYWLHQQSQGSGACASAITRAKPALPQTVKWSMLRDGFVLIDRQDFKIREVWKIDRVNRPSNVAGVNLNEADVIMQLLDKDLTQILWIRLLRRIGDVEGR